MLGYISGTPAGNRTGRHPLGSAPIRVGVIGRRWLPAFTGIDAADFVVAATATLLDARLLTRNVKHFPMFEGLAAPY